MRSGWCFWGGGHCGVSVSTATLQHQNILGVRLHALPHDYVGLTQVDRLPPVIQRGLDSYCLWV